MCTAMDSADILCFSRNILAVFLELRSGIHNAVLHSQYCGGGIDIDLLGILAGQNLNICTAKQSAAYKSSHLSLTQKHNGFLSILLMLMTGIHDHTE